MTVNDSQDKLTVDEEDLTTLGLSGVDYTKAPIWELHKDYDQLSYAERMEYDSVNYDYSYDDGGDGE